MKTLFLWSGLLVTAAILLNVSGCNAVGRPTDERFRQTGIPGEQYRVGGGFKISYTAPEAGVVYLVEHRTGTLLGTESLRRGQTFEFFPTQEVMDGFKRVNINLAEGEFVIYFVPDTDLYHR